MATEKEIAFFKGRNLKCDFCGEKILGSAGKYIGENGDENGENRDTILCRKCREKHDTNQSLRRTELKTGRKIKKIDY